MIGVDPQKLGAAVASSFNPKQRSSLARQSLDFIRPAKRERGAAIAGAGLTIEASTIEAAPSDLDFEIAEEQPSSELKQRQRVVIHATDRDHSKSGWAGHIVGVWEKRLPMKLFPEIPPAQVFGKEEIIADIMLVFKTDAAAESIPDVMHILRVHDR